MIQSMDQMPVNHALVQILGKWNRVLQPLGARASLPALAFTLSFAKFMCFSIKERIRNGKYR